MNLKNSIAYLKRVWRDDSSEPDLHLGEGDSPCKIDYSDDMSIFFLLDEGNSFRVVMDSDLIEKGVSLEELHRIGLKNLASIADQIEIKKNDDFLFFVGNGNFEASLILVDEIWDDWLSEHCPNGYIAALPARDILAVADREYPIEKLVELISRVWPDGDHLLSQSLYERKGNRWIPL